MKTQFKCITIIFSIIMLIVSAANAQGTYSGQAVKESSQAASHASQSVAYSVAAGSRVVSGIVAVPFIVIGESGKASENIGEELWDTATSQELKPLEISDKIITVGPPPDKALNR